MGREAMMVLSCESEGNEAVRILDALCNKGWSAYNKKNKIEFIPLGDDDRFDWQEDNISYVELRKIICQKQEKAEGIGFNLFYSGTDYGITLLFSSIKNIVISIGINRRSIDTQRESLTDFTWYFDTIIKNLLSQGIAVLSYRFEDYLD